MKKHSEILNAFVASAIILGVALCTFVAAAEAARLVSQ